MTSVSVIIPALNDAEFLRACLAALAAQTRLADEIIVVDNASTDATAAVARDAGVRVVVERLRGPLAATAAGFDAATGNLLARLDADSVPPVDWVARIHDHLDGVGTPTLVTGPGRFYGAGRLSCWIGTNLYVPGYFRSMGALLGHTPVFGSNFAMHAGVWRAVRGRVHRGVRTVHDDLDISIQLEPDVDVRYDRTLIVGVSARPFATLGGFLRRMWWVLFTLWLNRRGFFRRRRRWRRSLR